MNHTAKCAFSATVSFAAICATAFEYNVTRPAICPRWSGAEVGEWTMDRETAFAKAKAEIAYTIVLFTGSWWCPYCETLEAKVESTGNSAREPHLLKPLLHKNKQFLIKYILNLL